MLKNFEINEKIYVACDTGKTYNLENIEIKQRLNEDGYCVVTLGKHGKRKSVKVHRIIAELFVRQKDKKLEVNHIDGNKQNNNANNLEWVNRSEQILHAFKIGLKRADGEHNSNHKLNNEEVREIKNLIIQGKSIYSIAKLYGRGWQTINHIAKGNTWKNII